MDKMHALMLSHENHCRMMMCVTILHSGIVTFSNILGQNITVEQMRERTSGTQPKIMSLSSRFPAIMQLILTTSRLYRLPPVRFYLYICDSYCYQFRDLPLFVMAKPSNREGILIPDDSFLGNQTWEKSVTLINQNSCETKIPIIYFKGARTGRAEKVSKRHGVVVLDQKWATRCIFETHALTSKVMEVLLSGPQEAMHTWSKYKYLLNMPGEQPWSYRYKYLLVMKSLVIDIVVHQQYGSDPKNYNLRWDNFFDAFFRHNREYIQVPFRWIENDPEHNQREHQRVIQRVENIFAYYEKNQEAYSAIVQSCTRRVKCVSQAAVYHGTSVVIKEYAEAI
ncbi:hypothetical protein T484DRAFT_1758362 [Baffinella frigidus]|nr:hypothetical protein T484DRAFT_1758362 [Cryptophyta sp. CCMP2293]